MSSEKILSIIAGENFDEKGLIELLFDQYRIARNKKTVYNEDDHIPQNLIKMYYSSNDHSEFTDIVDAFKKKYSSQESRLEEVHSKKEIEGLGLVYDYIRSDEWEKCPNIYLILQIHRILFSKTPYPEAGGVFRTINIYLPGTGIATSNYDMIAQDISKLYLEFNQLLNEGTNLGIDNKSENEENLIRYVNKCIELKCKLIKIHPFYDGNGRTMRALVNLLFKLAGLPPIYVKYSERIPYENAMNKAINDNDYSLINKFYYYKICDSILELDINERKNNEARNKKIKK